MRTSGTRHRLPEESGASNNESKMALDEETSSDETIADDISLKYIPIKQEDFDFDYDMAEEEWEGFSDSYNADDERGIKLVDSPLSKYAADRVPNEEERNYASAFQDDPPLWTASSGNGLAVRDDEYSDVSAQEFRLLFGGPHVRDSYPTRNILMEVEDVDEHQEVEELYDSESDGDKAEVKGEEHEENRSEKADKDEASENEENSNHTTHAAAHHHDPDDKLDSEYIEVYVQTLCNRIMTFNVFADDTILRLMRMIKLCLGSPITHQRLVFAGKRLQENRTFMEYNIRKESTLHLILGLRGCVCGCTPEEKDMLKKVIGKSKEEN